MESNNTQRATELGYEHGRARASWMWDGNTTQKTYEEFLRLDADCDLPDDYLPPDPLSGEWAGESIPELLGDEFPELLSDDVDVDYWHGDILMAYEDGFRQGWHDYLVDTALYMTTPYPDATQVAG